MAIRQLGTLDIRFDDAKLRQLMEHINRVTRELQAIQEMLSAGQQGQVLVKLSGRDFHAAWRDAGGGGGGGGEANTGANVGSGAGVFRDKSGVQLNFRSLVGGSGISVAVSGDEITISATQSADELEPMLIAGAY